MAMDLLMRATLVFLCQSSILRAGSLYSLITYMHISASMLLVDINQKPDAICVYIYMMFGNSRPI